VKSLGGESQKASLNHVTSYSTYAQYIGKPAYLDPNRDTMQKPIGGLPVMALFTTKNALKKRRGEGTEKKIGAYLKN
jgi:hypothetical protein